MTTRYLICGGRDFLDYGMMDRALRNLILHPEDAIVIHGAARGADTLAHRWAQCYGAQAIACPADWNAHPRAAGPIRNSSMLADHKPDVVIAFPGGRGTADMVRKARAAGVIVIEVTA
jgi:hypothetical protein